MTTWPRLLKRCIELFIAERIAPPLLRPNATRGQAPTRRAFPAAGLRSALSPDARPWFSRGAAMESADVSCSKRQACPREALWTQPLYDVENRRYVSIAQLRHWAVE